MCDCEERQNKDTIKRRKFLTKLTSGIGMVIGAILAFPLITAMLDPVTRKKKQVWRRVGGINDFKLGETKMVTFKSASPYVWSKKIANSAAYLRRESNEGFVAFSVNCAHLGCPVRWVEKSELFLCPCHGGVYYKDGSRAAGPPPRGLYKYPLRLKDEVLEIETQAIPITTMDA